MEPQSNVRMRSKIEGTRAREGSVDDKEEQEDEEESQRSCGGASINGWRTGFLQEALEEEEEVVTENLNRGSSSEGEGGGAN